MDSNIESAIKAELTWCPDDGVTRILQCVDGMRAAMKTTGSKWDMQFADNPATLAGFIDHHIRWCGVSEAAQLTRSIIRMLKYRSLTITCECVKCGKEFTETLNIAVGAGLCPDCEFASIPDEDVCPELDDAIPF